MTAVWIRMLAYVASPFLGLFPAWLAGLVIYTAATGDLYVATDGIWTALLSGGVLSAAIFALWGVKAPPWLTDGELIKAVAGSLTRVTSYWLSTAVASLPVAFVGLIELVPGGVVFHLASFPSALGIGFAGSAAIFAKFGLKPSRN